EVARARGFARSTILLREALPNAVIPTVALGGVQVTLLLGGTVLVERIFSYEGMGNMTIDAVINRDLPLIQGLVLTFAVLFIALNLLVDLLVTALDPRLRRVGVVRGGTRLAVGGVLIAVLLLTALLSPIIAPHDPLEQDLLSSQLPPAWMAGGDKNFLLGTDSLGRCVLSRIIYAART